VLIIFLAITWVGWAATGMTFAVWAAGFAAMHMIGYDTSGMASAQTVAMIGLAALIINVMMLLWVRSNILYRKEMFMQRVRNPIENIGLVLVVAAYLARRWIRKKDRL
jgi:hypothetical protein